MEKVSLFCGKIELIASKPTLEIREAVIVYYEYQSLPYIFSYLLVYPKTCSKIYPFWPHYKPALHDYQTHMNILDLLWQSGIVSETGKPD